MSTQRWRRASLGLAALTLVAAGCGAPPTTGAPAAVGETTSFVPMQSAQDDQQGGQQAQQPPDVTEVFPFLANVGLSQDQKNRIIDALKSGSPPLTQQQAQQRQQRFEQLLSAPTLDRAALREYFLEAIQLAGQQAEAGAQKLAAMRGILTPQQRVAAAQAIRNSLKQQTASPAPDQGSDQQGNDQDQQGSADQGEQQGIQLTDAQKQAFAAASSQQDPKVAGGALATFFEKGDQAAYLEATRSALDPDTQADRIVAAYASLSADQRRQIVQSMKQGQQQGQQQDQDTGE